MFKPNPNLYPFHNRPYLLSHVKPDRRLGVTPLPRGLSAPQVLPGEFVLVRKGARFAVAIDPGRCGANLLDGLDLKPMYLDSERSEEENEEEDIGVTGEPRKWDKDNVAKRKELAPTHTDVQASPAAKRQLRRQRSERRAKGVTSREQEKVTQLYTVACNR